MRSRESRKLPLSAILLSTLLFGSPALGGPPFFTDDPEPVELDQYEFYLFSTTDTAADSTSVQPAVEFNAGIFPETQLHLVTPLEKNMGNVEVGIKYRFARESAARPMVGVFPMVELPCGSKNVWFKLPVWLQKSWGDWTSYGGGGFAVNSTPGMNNYWYGGWLLQKKLNEHLTLGGELFAQPAALINFGGYYSFDPHCSLLFTLGRSISSETHYYSYFGLYWTW